MAFRRSSYWWYLPHYWTPSTVRNILYSTDGFPQEYWIQYPPQYWWYLSTVLMISPTILMVSLNSMTSPTVLNILRSTEHPLQYWCFPSRVLNSISSTVLMISLHSTDDIPYNTDGFPKQYDIPHSTEHPLQYLLHRRSPGRKQRRE